MVIESYSFGHMVVDGTAYSRDVLIYPDRSVFSPWWRKSGHRIELSDIEEMVRMKPQAIIVGTGDSGFMRPTPELENFLFAQGLEFIALPTAQAVAVYNEMIEKKRIGGCFHLTC